MIWGRDEKKLKWFFYSRIKKEAEIPNVKETRPIRGKPMRILKFIKTHFNLSRSDLASQFFQEKKNTKVRLPLLSGHFSFLSK